MSEVAGRMAVQAGAMCLEIKYGGRGMLLGGVPGVTPGKVTIIGGGVVGSNAALIAAGMGAQVSILDNSIARLAHLDFQFKSSITTLYSTNQSIRDAVLEADMVVALFSCPEQKPLNCHSRYGRYKRGSVIVDVAIDQGGWLRHLVLLLTKSLIFGRRGCPLLRWQHAWWRRPNFNLRAQQCNFAISK